MKNDYFKILDVPKKLLIDHNELKRQYFKLLKENSGDRVLDDNPETKDDKNKLALIESAYQTLKDRVSRIQHLLEIEGIEVIRSKAPTQFVDIANEVKTTLPIAKNGEPGALQKLKKLHKDILNEFSKASVELAHLEKAWDTRENQEPQDLLKKINRKSAALNYIRDVEQDIRQTIS